RTVYVIVKPAGSAGRTVFTSAEYGPTPRIDRLAAIASAATASTIATTTVPWYCDAEGVAIPARLQIAQMDSSGPGARARLLQCRRGWEVGSGRVIAACPSAGGPANRAA